MEGKIVTLDDEGRFQRAVNGRGGTHGAIVPKLVALNANRKE